jgi:predicted dehydrogenase
VRNSSARTLRLGVIGLSEGNGHPYSWSAIFNGYDREVMAECPFAAIPAYLAKRRFPEDQLQGACVTQVWTQDLASSRHIARAARIPKVARDFRDMLGEVDALLLARDDAEHHLAFAEIFLEAGIPVYLDKPPALSVAALDELFGRAKQPAQIFSCSALRFANELRLSADEARAIGPLKYIAGVTPKSWERYAAHVIDPILSFVGPGHVTSARPVVDRGAVTLSVDWSSGLQGEICATGLASGKISLTYQGESGSLEKVFADPFLAFRAALQSFVQGAQQSKSDTPYAHLKSMVELIEMGTRTPLRVIGASVK